MSGGAVGLAQVCFCPGAGEAHMVPVILSGAILGHISALGHSGPAEVGSCSRFLPSARLVLVTSPGHTRGPLPTLVQDLEGFPLFAIISVAPLGDALPWAKLLMPQWCWTHPCSRCSSHLRLRGHAIAAERVREHHHGAAAAGAGQRGSHQVGGGCRRARPQNGVGTVGSKEGQDRSSQS